LFAIEASVKIRNSKTVTEEKAYWMLPTTVNKVEFKRVKDIDFTSAKTKKKQLDQAIAEDSPINPGPRQRKMPTAPEPTAEELKKFYTDLSKSGTRPAILSVVPQFAQSYRPEALDKKYPAILSELYSAECGSYQKDVLLKHCEETFSSVVVTEEEAVNCEIATREQANCKQWFHFRIGRITASRAKRVCRTAIENPSKSLIKDICYPLSRKFSSKATEWGCEHEKEARSQYMNEMAENHVNFHVRDVGFVISTEHPYLGASPDGIASCDCCGEFLIEIKCPYCKRDCDVNDSLECLHTVNNNLELIRTHQYYYQVQCQLLVTGKTFCDFIVWTNKDMFVERIAKNESICIEIGMKSEQFFKVAVLPELMGKLYSRPLQEQTPRAAAPAVDTVQSGRKELICVCQKEYNKESDNVIGCDDENCPYVWLHFKCAGIKRVPKGKWLCKHCRSKKK
jgi:hypothetical protein